MDKIVNAMMGLLVICGLDEIDKRLDRKMETIQQIPKSSNSNPADEKDQDEQKSDDDEADPEAFDVDPDGARYYNRMITYRDKYDRKLFSQWVYHTSRLFLIVKSCKQGESLSWMKEAARKHVVDSKCCILEMRNLIVSSARDIVDFTRLQNQIYKMLDRNHAIVARCTRKFSTYKNIHELYTKPIHRRLTK
jgi:hypothetical protein